MLYNIHKDKMKRRRKMIEKQTKRMKKIMENLKKNNKNESITKII